MEEIFTPLNDLIHSDNEEDDNNQFFIPLGGSAQTMSAGGIGVIVAWVLSNMDALLPRDSWPWVLSRETVCNLAGYRKFTQAELNTLMQSDRMVPVGSLATAYLLRKVDSKQARAFAERGLKRLSIADFRVDYDILLQTNAAGNRVLVNTLGILRNINDDQLKAFAVILPADQSSFLQEPVKTLRQKQDLSAAVAAWPVVEKNWDSVMKPLLEKGLNQFMPQVQFLTDPKALYDRGRTLVSSEAVVQDFDEAAQCFKKAADQGHAGAQKYLGILYSEGKGVPQDYAAAMRWYLKANAQKEPHSGCLIGELYQDGKGVKKDLDEAAKWFQKEADTSCSSAQYHLALIYESKQKMTEAISLYQRSAEAGERAAQFQLSELLSEGLSVPADYVQSCKWLLLVASDSEDKIIQFKLRRLKAKLTPEQWEQAESQAADLQKRIDEKKAAGKKKK